ncbi:MAG: hypothetical protein ACSI46_08205 [Gloeotrichia echinulata DVL01]
MGIGDWGLGIGDTSTSSVHRWGLGTLRQAQCIAGDWGLGIGDWGQQLTVINFSANYAAI